MAVKVRQLPTLFERCFSKNFLLHHHLLPHLIPSLFILFMQATGWLFVMWMIRLLQSHHYKEKNEFYMKRLTRIHLIAEHFHENWSFSSTWKLRLKNYLNIRFLNILNLNDLPQSTTSPWNTSIFTTFHDPIHYEVGEGSRAKIQQTKG